ncbi:transcriptional attenuator, LytR family [Paenibacillus uliginis N3/975]|uniref:Transcriptional attenuator, LytR family n=1 Tax=Paenibacillus uliginis N3/975 TaxID=1313296 RepID=A0A1X7HHA4_9BACL|nr:LCP family protein [Paenibacillus uliginis]SMF86597.1 transcriptional attenuator, LytR family [Paenibacillus uliginis N3/975]
MSIKPKKKAIRKVMMIIYLVIIALILGVGIYVGYIYYKADAAIQRVAAPKLADDPIGNVKKESIQPMTFLLAGVDSRDGADGVMNTDVLMLVSFNPQTHSASMLSLPRDLLLKPKSLPSRKSNYYYAYYYIKDKSEAIPNTKRFFSDLLGFPIDHMVVLNFDALRQTVDALGGLEIDVDMDMKYNDSADGTHIDLKKGLQTLNGQQVLDFVRYRKSNQGTRESSDFARNDRQQQVIKQIIEKLGDFQGISQWGNVLDIIGENVKSDIPESDLQQWVYNFPKIKPNHIRSLQLESSWKSPYVYVKKEDLQQALATLRDEAGVSSESRLNLEAFGLLD